MERKDISEKYKWKVSDIFSSDEAWEECRKTAERKIDFSTYEGTLSNVENLIRFFKAQEEVGLLLERLYLYAHMRHDEDTRDAKYTSMQSQAMSLYVSFSSATAFFEPELIALNEDILKSFITNEKLKDYDYFLRQLLKSKKHVLSPAEEKLLAMGGEVYSQFQNIFSMIDNADLRFGEIEGEAGEKIELTHGTYGVIMHDGNRERRRIAFEKYYDAYIQLKNTIAAVYFGNVKKDVVLAKARKYESCLQKALSGEDVEISVYDNLICSVHKSLPSMHRYITLRKQILKLSEQHMYDIYAPLVEDAELKLSYEDACTLVIKGLSVLGEDYCSLLQQGFENGWVDVYETTGKRSGAYSTGIFGLHPYVLLNYQKTTHDVFTIAHEMGHAMHTYYSNKSQPYAKADYRIFVAEVASTVNEVLLLKYILASTEDIKIRKYLLNYYLDMIRTTLYRQTMFAEFEAIAHQDAEAGVPLTSDHLCQVYLGLNQKYYGSDIVHDKEIAYEWSRIPHFYTSFYVYKYATGIISAISIANRILSEGSAAVSDYKRFLSSGGSDSPVNLLRLAGIDLTKQDAFDTALNEFEKTLSTFESLIG